MYDMMMYPRYFKSKSLSGDQAKKVCELAWEGSMTQKEIGEKFGIGSTTVSSIKTGHSYAGHTVEVRRKYVGDYLNPWLNKQYDELKDLD